MKRDEPFWRLAVVPVLPAFSGIWPPFREPRGGDCAQWLVALDSLRPSIFERYAFDFGRTVAAKGRLRLAFGVVGVVSVGDTFY